MKGVSCEDEDAYEGKKFGDDITKEIEQALHNEIKNAFDMDLEDKDSSRIISFLDESLEGSDASVEGFEQLSDYGNVTIKVKKVV